VVPSLGEAGHGVFVGKSKASERLGAMLGAMQITAYLTLTGALICISVSFCESVAITAMSFRLLLLSRCFTRRICAYSPLKIYSLRYWFQMLRIYATTNAAEMVYLKSIGYRAYKQFICYAMAIERTSGADGPYSSIARGFVDKGQPKPASGIGLWDYFRDKPFMQCFAQVNRVT
jgi:hypothetical protein